MSSIAWMASLPPLKPFCARPQPAPGMTTRGTPRKQAYRDGRKVGSGKVDRQIVAAFDKWPVGYEFSRIDLADATPCSLSYARLMILRLVECGAASKPFKDGKAKKYTKLFAKAPDRVLAQGAN